MANQSAVNLFYDYVENGKLIGSHLDELLNMNIRVRSNTIFYISFLYIKTIYILIYLNHKLSQYYLVPNSQQIQCIFSKLPQIILYMIYMIYIIIIND